ncbi:twin-arginine translocation signal domain-containing protein, partial [Campylobacter jejuni]|nr:twin-arginine translocation signal domain-containing protein [Campylobacter jejuni]
MNRRDFIKNTAIASAASVAGLSVPSSMLARKKKIGNGIKLFVDFV